MGMDTMKPPGTRHIKRTRYKTAADFMDKYMVDVWNTGYYGVIVKKDK